MTARCCVVPIRSWPRRRSTAAVWFVSAADRSRRRRRRFAACSISCRPRSAMIPGPGNGDDMHLTPRDIDKLLLHQAGFLAQKRLARGLRLNYVEAMALIATQLLEF